MSLIIQGNESSESSAHSIEKAQSTFLIAKIMGKFNAVSCQESNNMTNLKKYIVQISSKIIPSTLIDILWTFKIREDQIDAEIQLVDKYNLYTHLKTIEKNKQLITYSKLRNAQNNVFDDITHTIFTSTRNLIGLRVNISRNVSIQNNFYSTIYRRIHKLIKVVNFQFSRLLIKFRFVQDKITQNQYQKNRLSKSLRAVLYFRQQIQKNRMSRTRRSVISLKSKELKIISEAMQIKQKGAFFFNQIKQVKINPKQFSTQKKMYESYCQQISSRQIKQYNGKSSQQNDIKPLVIPIMLKQYYDQTLLIQGALGIIYKAICVFKEEISVHKYTEMNSEYDVHKYKSLSKSTQFEYLKRILIRKESTAEGQFSFQNQIKFLTYVRNMIYPFVATYYCESEQEPFQNNKIYVQKYDQSVADILYRLKTWERLKIVLQVAKALNFLKRLQICHRDLKPKNIMVDFQTNARVIDWGSCCSLYGSKNGFKQHDDRLYSSQGYFQSYYAVNGLYFKQKYSQQQFEKGQFFDIYSFGQVLCYMFDLKQGGQSESWLIKQLYYVAMKCKQPNPQDRLNSMQLQAYLYLLFNTHEDQFE